MKYFAGLLLMTVSGIKLESNMQDCGLVPSINAMNTNTCDSANTQIGAKCIDAGSVNNICKDHNDCCDINRYVNRAKTTCINKKANQIGPNCIQKFNDWN